MMFFRLTVGRSSAMLFGKWGRTPAGAPATRGGGADREGACGDSGAGVKPAPVDVQPCDPVLDGTPKQLGERQG
jgi:hypothetical protein